MKGGRLLIYILTIIVIVVVISAFYMLQRAKHIREQGEERIPKVSLRLNWIPDPTFTGAYIAKLHRFWQDLNIEVEIKPGGMNLDPVRLVTNGMDNFGITGADRLLYARAQGLPLVAISLELRDNPVGWIVRKDSDIHSFHDFIGKRVGQKYGSETEAIFDATLSILKIDPATIKVIPVQFSLHPFLNKQVDAFPVYINEEPHTVEAKGVKVRVIHPFEYGIHPYGNVAFTLESTVRQKPDLVQSFVNGLLDGWHTAFQEEPTKIAEKLVRIEPDMGNVPTEKVLISTLELVRGRDVGSEKRIGWMELYRWEQTHHILSEHAGLKKEMNIEAAFTNQFIERYYME